MKNTIQLLICTLLIFSSTEMFSQVIPVPDSFCVNFLEPIPLSVKANDEPPNSMLNVAIEGESDCFILREDGTILWRPDANPELCCGRDHVFTYFYPNAQPQIFEQVTITVKCSKPDCGLVNLSDLADSDDPIGGQNGKPTIDACENSLATYFVDYNPAYTYIWTFSGESSSSYNPAFPNEIDIVWGSFGGGFISVSIYNSDTTILLQTIDVCVNILEGPEAAFTAVDSCVCLNSPISFINNSIGGNDYFWEFGDGMISTAYAPTHQYATPGTYTVTLYVTQDNYTAEGNPTCCCTDTAMMTVTVDSLEGPNIYWISTLCEGDSSKYWTDADCGSYTWTAMDANGVAVPIIPTANPDTICVVWPTGPYGTITLQTSGCTPPLCEKPVSVNVPVIQSVAQIAGETVVCANSTESYTLPKWPSVEYQWTVSGGIIEDGQGSNSVIINWGAAGTGTINVMYGSEFLNGLPIHDGDDCYGTATLTVDIRDRFSVNPLGSTVCVGDATSHFASPATAYNWTISPNPGFSLPSGVSNVTINWNTTPGSYTVSVAPSGVNPYCNDTVRFLVIVTDIEMPDSVSGAFSICPGETYTYFPYSNTPNIGFNWIIDGGTVDNPNGNPVQITWDNVGPYKIGLTQFDLNDPMCESDTLCYPVTPKSIQTPIVIDGTDACVNEIANYVQTTAQDDDAVYKWRIDPPQAGSVIFGQGGDSIEVQWNNLEIMADLICTICLCGDSVQHIEPIDINAADIPVITQKGYLCPGVPADLCVPNTYVTYQWSHTATNNFSVPIMNAGVYTLTVTDADGCTAVASFEAFNVAGPIADISTPSPTSYCLPDNFGDMGTIVAQTTGNEWFTWYCDGSVVPQPNTQSWLDYTVSTPGVRCYWVDVQDQTTLCISRSDTICVTVAPECESGPCIPENYSINTTATVNPTFCNQVTFNTSGSNFTVVGWDFLDPGNNSFTGPITSPTHIYTEAGCYLARVTIQVPSVNGGFCQEFDTASVCVPVAADFQWSTDCAKFSFEDLSTYIAPDAINAWAWTFEDDATNIIVGGSSMQNPMFTFEPGKTYNITLTVQTISGCQATITKQINTYGVPDATFTATPGVVCVGDEIHFQPVGPTTSILYYDWDFGDTSGNGGMDPYHSYTSDGTYNVSLIVEDVNGCRDTFDLDVIVHPLPPYDTISWAPSLTICEGETVTLTAPSDPGGIGYSYLWNTGSTMQSIVVSTSGFYSVVVTDMNNCEMIPDSVEVIVISIPQPEISGPELLCENNCITLSTALGFGYTYVWYDQFNMPIPFPYADGNKLEICHPFPVYTTVTVEVTDANGCTRISDPHNVNVVPNPGVSINILSGGLCEGDPTDLEAISPTIGATFQWSNGVSGPFNTVVAEGTYTVTATDPATGCTSVTSVVVNPQPDLCIVPVGCYEVCDPDTICGPDGLVAYQWNKDGSPIPGPQGTQQCLIVTEDGTYTLTGTNSFGCTTTSDSLILEVILCCVPGDTDVTATPVMTNGDSCCWSLSYMNSINAFFGMTIRTNDADLNMMTGSLDPAFGFNGAGSNYVSLTNAVVTNPLPTGTVNNFIDICLENLTATPATVFVDWHDEAGDVICTDTLMFDCLVEPPCVYISQDSIYCQNDQVIYQFTICNPASNTFPIGYVDLVPLTPPGVIITPGSFDYTGSPILPGNCRNESLTISGGNFSNQFFCFDILAHDFNPALVDSAECCSADTTYCIQIPGCTPCDMVYISSIDTVDIDECCFEVELTNNFNGMVYTGIDICALNGSTIQVQNTLGTMWNTLSTSPSEVSLGVSAAAGGLLPLGSSTLPDICVTSSQGAFTDIVIKWMKGPNIECADTITLFCPGDCGYVIDSVFCGPDGGWIYEGYIVNTSGVTMDDAIVSFTTPGYEGLSQNIALGGLLPGATFGPFFIFIDDAIGNANDEVCMTITLHSQGHSNQHEECCSFTHCFELPDCGGGEPDCECQPDFEDQVALGFDCSFDPLTGIGTFTPIGQFSDCDKIIWDFLDLQVSQMSIGNQSIQQLFTKEGEYTICMTVIRTTPAGKQCKEKFTKEFEVELPGSQGVTTFPNPANRTLSLSFRKLEAGTANIRLVDLSGRTVGSWESAVDGHNVLMPIGDFAEGIYHLIVQTDSGRFVKKVLISR